MTDIHVPNDDWNSHWDKFAESASKNPAQEYRHTLIISFIKRKFHNSHINVLDVGSGQGDFLLKLQTAYPLANLMGFELSRSGVEISKKKIPGVSFYEVDMLNQPMEIEKYYSWATVICCSEVLEHTDDPALFLEKILPFISPNGMIIVTVPGGPMSDFDKVIGHRQHFSVQKLTDLFLAAGYKTPSVVAAGFPFHNLYRMVVMLRGRKLEKDVSTGYVGVSKYLAKAAMAIFKLLYKLNLTNTAFGWQIVGIACKS